MSLPEPWARWRAKSAISYAASLVDVTGNGRDLTTGVEPPWTMFKGWRFDGASHLVTPFIPASQDVSVLVQFSGFEGYNSIFGVIESGDGCDIQPNAEGEVEYLNGGADGAAPALFTGNLAVAGDKGYRDGVVDVTGLQDYGVIPTNPLTIGGSNINGVVSYPVIADVQEVRVYDLTLTVDQVAEVANEMAVINRETVRDALATLLDTELVQGAPQIAEAVYNYQKSNLKGESPVVLVYGAGSERPRGTLAGNTSEIGLWVVNYVATATSGDYDEADAEDVLDRIEKAVGDVIEANQTTANWHSIAYDGRSATDSVSIGGVPYIVEYIPIMVQVFG